MRTRRGFLAATSAALAGLGGCISANEDVDVGNATETERASATPTRQPTSTTTAGATGTRTRTRTGTATPTPRATPARLAFDGTYESEALAVELDLVGHVHSLIYRDGPGAAAVGATGGTQFLFVDVRATVAAGRAPAPEEFVLVDGETVDRGWTRYDDFDGSDAEFRGSAETFGDPYDRERGRGWIGFAVPERFPAGNARVALTRDRRRVAEWSLPREATGPLARRPPEWEVGSFSGPGSGPGDRIELSVTNRGNHEDSFPVVLNYTGDVAVFETHRERVPPGQTRIWRTDYAVGSPTDPDFEVVTPVRRFDFDT